MDNCTNCKYAVFDKQWGEYKCNFYNHRIYILLDSSECRNYKKDHQKKES